MKHEEAINAIFENFNQPHPSVSEVGAIIKEYAKAKAGQHETIVIGDTLTTPICSCCKPEYDTGFKCVNCGKYELRFAQGERQ